MKRVCLCLIVFIVILFLVSTQGCHSKKQSTLEPVSQPTTMSEPEPHEPKQLSQEELSQNRLDEITKQLQPIFFDFDKSSIRQDQMSAMNKNSTILKNHPDVKLLIEGHCDERGTEEYNLALGERRAKAVRDYLVDLGVMENRIQTISYGESRPFEYAHNEQAWQQNRRGQPIALVSEDTSH